MNKFTTIHPKLFNNKFSNSMPDWIANLDIKHIKEKEALNINFDKKEAWSEAMTIQRDERDYNSKEITANLNNNEILLSKIELSKFLKNKYYDVKESNIKNNSINLKTIISNVPGEFNFIYNIKNNKIENNNVFTYNDNEYPFNNMGFEECLNDIKNKKVESSIKVQNVDKASIISREEIFRRYNGHIRQATDKINELLKDGTIIGVTSNSYGTFYDVDYLFPQQEKEAMPEKAPEFEFVQNMEKVAMTPHKSAYQLAMEASSEIGKKYDDFKINGYERNGDKLKIFASVLENNKTYSQIISADIDNEKIKNIKFNENKIIDNRIKTKKQNRLYNKNIISKNKFKNLLKTNAYFDVDIDEIFDNLVINKIITPINQDEYSSTITINDIIDLIDLNNPDENKYKELIDKLNNLKLNRNDVKDTGIREDIKLSKEYRLLTLYNYLSQKFKKFKLKNFEKIDENNYECDMIFVNEGLKSRLHILIKYNKSKIDKIIAKINDKKYSLKDIINSFCKKKSLKNYLNDNNANIHTDKIILTTNQIFDKLSNFVDENIIDDIINNWIENNQIINIGNDMFVSDYTFEELINLSDFEILSDEEKQELLESKIYFGEGLSLNRNEVKDTGFREDIQLSKEYRLLTLYNYLSQKFKKFELTNFEKIDENNYECDIMFINDGIRNKLHILIRYNKSKIDKVIAEVNDKRYSLKDIINSFYKKNSLKNYLNNNNANIHTDKIILTTNQIFDKLSNFVDINIVNDIIDEWIKNNLIINIGNDMFVSDYTFEELINLSDFEILSEKEKQEILESKIYFGEGLSLNRNDIKDTGFRETKEYVSNQTLINNINQYLSKYFNDFEINDLNIYNNENEKLVNYNIKVFNDENGLSLNININLNCEGNDIKDCNCIINGKNINIENVKKAFIINESLNKSLTLFNGKKIKSNIIITKQSLKNKLNKIANIDDTSLDKTIELLIKNNKLDQISLDTFASKYTLEELINYSNLKPLSDEQFLEKIKKAQINKMNKLSKNYINDNDTRLLYDNWSNEKIKTHISSKLNKVFNNYDILNFELNNNKYIVSIKATDLDGLNKIILCYFNIDKGHPGEIIEITNLNNDIEEINEYIKNYKPNTFNNKGIITKNQLLNNLFNLIDINDIDNIINDLIVNDVLNTIGTDKYAMNCTMSDIVAYLSKNKNTNLIKGKNNILKRIDKSKKIDTNIKHDIENDTRELIKEEKLSLQGEKVKKDLLILANNMYANKKITMNRLNNINKKLNNVKTDIELNDIYQELQKCL